MTDDDVSKLAAATSASEVAIILDGLATRPDDFVIATPDHVIVAGAAAATVGDVTFRHTGDGTFTRHSLAPLISAAGASDSGAVAPGGREPVRVRGLLCQRGHLVHPEARMCPLCGDNMQNRSILVSDDGVVGELGPRPPLGVVILPDGTSYQLERNTVIGRAPETHPEVQAGLADAICVDDSELSRAHLRFVLHEWNVSVEDLSSTNGTRVGTGPSARELIPAELHRLQLGVDISAGTSVINYQPTSAAPT